jgi:glycosyltransferase involved in cell wall biosynthesis
MSELLTICIPTYNRPGYLEQCLESILAQSFQEYRIVILDNASERDYTPILTRFVDTDRRISYRRYSSNLGAEGHGPVIQEYLQTKYLMVFHDDDLMHPRLLENEVAILEQNADVQFVSTTMRHFAGPPPSFPQIASTSEVVFCRTADLAEKLLRGFQLHYGSTMYRSAALRGHLPDHGRFAKIHDRPFLLEVARQGRCALISQPLVLYRNHPDQDSRTGALAEDHLIELYRAYREALAEKWDPGIACLFYRTTGYELLGSYGRLLPEKRSPVLLFLHKCRRAGVLRYPFVLFYPLTKGTNCLRLARGSTCRCIRAIIPVGVRGWVGRLLRRRQARDKSSE